MPAPLLGRHWRWSRIAVTLAAAPVVQDQLAGHVPTGNDTGTPPDGHGPNVPPRHPPHRGKDPQSVLDAYNAIVLNQNVIKHDYSTYTVSLFAQVSGALVTTYAWDLSGATDAQNSTGTSSYNLKFNWQSFTGAARSEKVKLTITTGAGPTTYTFPYLVYGTDSPGYTATQPTTFANWPTVLLPDAIKADQDTIAGQFYSLSPDTGELMVNYPLPSYNPGIDPIELVYSSTAANRQPIFVTHYPIDPTRTDVPTSVVATLSITGGTGSSATYSTTGLVNPGDLMQIALQGDETGMATGRYSYSISVTANYAAPPTPVTSNILGKISVGYGWVGRCVWFFGFSAAGFRG